jgi:hypothetical protein
MANARATGVSLEVLRNAAAASSARVTSAALEVLAGTDPAVVRARVTNVGLETLGGVTPTRTARVTQVALEVLCSVSNAPVAVYKDATAAGDVRLPGEAVGTRLLRAPGAQGLVDFTGVMAYGTVAGIGAVADISIDGETAPGLIAEVALGVELEIDASGEGWPVFRACDPLPAPPVTWCVLRAPRHGTLHDTISEY